MAKAAKGPHVPGIKAVKDELRAIAREGRQSPGDRYANAALSAYAGDEVQHVLDEVSHRHPRAA